MGSREQRIATLAATLKSSGIAKSDSQAKMMAEDMVGVEDHVQKDFEESHTRATDYLSTAKNLGNPRPAFQEQKPEPKKIEPVGTINKSNSRIQEMPSVSTDVNFGGKTLNQAYSHDTNNAALEAIKTSVGATHITPLEDMKVTPKHQYVSEMIIEKPEAKKEVDEILEPPEKPDELEALKEGKSIEQPIETVQEAKTEAVEKQPETIEASEEPVEEAPKLDAEKLVEMMEEDGKMEEHTREIKTKPENVKPKEDYAENSIDLSSVFGFKRK